MDELSVGALVYAPPEDVYALLAGVPRYADYSKHLAAVTRSGDGGPGTEYALRFSWWKVGYTVRSRVTAAEPPRRIAFELVRGIAAEGEWRIDPAEAADAPAGDADGQEAIEEACRVRLIVRYDPETVADDAVDLPALVPIGWVIERAEPLIEREAGRVVERAVADVEGEPRDVPLSIETR